MSDFNRYQYSVFLKNGRDAQLVIRSDDKEEFKQMLSEFDGLVALTHVEVKTGNEESFTRVPVTTPVSGGQEWPVDVRNKCPQCGAPAQQRSGIGQKTGKPYTGMFCTASRDHKPSFI